MANDLATFYPRMRTMVSPTLLEVLLHGQPIGTLSLLAGDQTVFAFRDEYIEDPDRPRLSLSFTDTLGGLITDIRPTRRRVPPFFANLLPEGHMRTYLAERSGVNPEREFFLLEALGHDLPGALQVRAAAEMETADEAPTGGSAAATHLDPEEPLRFSLAGVQLKFSAAIDASGGLTIPAQGVGGSWIVKLPSATFGSVPQNEFVMMSLAKEVGIDVPEIRLVPLESIAGLPSRVGDLGAEALVVRRFDRPADAPAVHIEDFAQVFGVYPERKYENASYRSIAEVLWAEAGDQAIVEFVRRLVFSALIGNADMHLKNWSLIYLDGTDAVALAPAYDLVSTVAYPRVDRGMALNLYGPGTKGMSNISLKGLAKLAAKARLPEGIVLDVASETVERFNRVWPDAADLGPLPAFVRDAIDDHIGAVPLVPEVLGSVGGRA